MTDHTPSRPRTEGAVTLTHAELERLAAIERDLDAIRATAGRILDRLIERR